MTNPLKSFLNEAAPAALEQAHEDLGLTKRELSNLSFATREIAAECTHLRKELTLAKEDYQLIVDAREKEKGEAQKKVEELTKQLEAMAAELQGVAAEGDACTKKQSEALKTIEKLRQQLKVQSNQLLLTQNALSEKNAELQELQEEFHHLRLRYIRQRSG